MPNSNEANQMIREQCYLCIMTLAPNTPPATSDGTALAEAHKKFLTMLHREKAIIGSGKLENARENEHSELGFGMFILRAASRKEAEQIALQEPYTKAGHRIMKLVPWQRNALVEVR